VSDKPVIEAVIFDMDGILIDTEPVWRRVETEVFRRVGVSLDYEDTAQTMGMRIGEVVRLRHSEQPWGDEPSIDDVADEILAQVIDFVRREGEPLPGTLDAFQAVAAMNLPIGLASSSAHSLIDAVVDRLELRPYISAFSSADDVDASKPDPAVYLANARLLNTPPARCLAIEDSRNGVLAALGAGTVCCAVPDHYWRDDPEVARAHYRLESLTELPALLTRLAGS
jgi:mannitol-1-/sugar-/sorbitol-6-/2-deoxyglucose-6-phosphatase